MQRPRYTTARNGGKGYTRAIRNVPTLGQNIVKAIHTYSVTFGASSTATVKALAYSFNAAAFPGASNLLKTFDAYRITRLACKLTNLTPGKRMAYGYWPTVYWCSDENDDTVLPTLNWISAKSSTKTKTLMEGQSMRYSFVPTITNRTGLAGSYTMHQNVWMDAISSTEPHHGLKIVVTNFESKDVPQMQLEVKATIQYKGWGPAD